MTTITLTPDQVAEVVAAHIDALPAPELTQADYINNFGAAAAKYGWKYQYVGGVPMIVSGGFVPQMETLEAIQYDRIKQDMANKGVDLSFRDYMCGNFEHYSPEDVKPHEQIYLGYGKTRAEMPPLPVLN